MFNVGDLVVANCDAAGNGDLRIQEGHLYQVRKIWVEGGTEYLTVSLPDSSVVSEFYSWRFIPVADTRGQFKNSSIAPSGGVIERQTFADILDLCDWVLIITDTKSPRHIQAVRCKEMIFKLQQQGASHAQARQAEAETRPGEAPEAREALLGPRLVTVNHDNYGRARPELLLSSFCDND